MMDLFKDESKCDVFFRQVRKSSVTDGKIKSMNLIEVSASANSDTLLLDLLEVPFIWERPVKYQ